MASVAMMIGGAVLNAATFIGGNNLVKKLEGKSAAEKEKEHHDKALERDRTKLLDWMAVNAQIKAEAKQTFTNTDYAFKLYNKAHPDERIPPKEPKFSDFCQPSEG